MLLFKEALVIRKTKRFLLFISPLPTLPFWNILANSDQKSMVFNVSFLLHGQHNAWTCHELSKENAFFKNSEAGIWSPENWNL